ncbi:MAG: M48 family metallopeptidase [Desulfovibrio sp.]|nr:M48 family metallopeptidase [Desulfovibrio sp.]
MQSNDNPRLCARALQCWCRIKATCCLPAFLERLATKGGFVINNVSVRDQRGRWGSCSTRGNKGASASVNISLNWRTLLLPVPLLEHLCWHELCHLRHMDHSPAYHEELARFSPHWTQYEKALQNVWRDMPWWALPENGPATPPRR